MTTTRTTTTGDERRRALLIAARTGCDIRTALRAMREGPQVIRTMRVREDVAAAMAELGGASDAR